MKSCASDYEARLALSVFASNGTSSRGPHADRTPHITFGAFFSTLSGLILFSQRSNVREQRSFKDFLFNGCTMRYSAGVFTCTAYVSSFEV